MKCAWLVCWLVLCLAGSGCGKPQPSSGPPLAKEEGITRAQPRLPAVKLWLGTQELKAEVARTPQQVQTGLMFRTNIAEDEGMLFVFAVPHQAAFWMKNVPIPLSCAYLDPEGIILETHDMEPGNTNAIVAGTERIQFVLETRAGWFERNHVGTGVLVRTEFGPLGDTFLRRSTGARAP